MLKALNPKGLQNLSKRETCAAKYEWQNYRLDIRVYLQDRCPD
jgi:hypothetical protein